MGRSAHHIATVPWQGEAVTENDGRNKYGLPGIRQKGHLTENHETSHHRTDGRHHGATEQGLERLRKTTLDLL